MDENKIQSVAEKLIKYSVSLRPFEKILINCTQHEIPLVRELVRQAYAAKAFPFINMMDNELKKEILLGFSEEQAKIQTSWEELRMDNMDVYISVVTSSNHNEFLEVPNENMKLYVTTVGQNMSRKIRDKNIRWCAAIYPMELYANNAGMSLEQFEDFYYKVCCLDYEKLGNAMDKLVEIMQTTDKVRVCSEGTDLVFSIKGINKLSSKGNVNLPDGEVYTAPVKDSVNGFITFNTATVYQGIRFEKIRLEFKNGKVISATANDSNRLNDIISTDEGARYTGEFAIGVNPYIMHPIDNILFDEKINGSIHIALGNALDLTDNGNRSAVHWDLVLIQRKDYGGGEIYFDGQLVRKDGNFILPELLCLNRVSFID